MDFYSTIFAFFKTLISPVTNYVQYWLGVNREHDCEVFRKLDTIANEARIDEILNGRIYTSSLRSEDDYSLADLIEALGRIENRYLDRTLQKRASELAQEMAALLAFVRQTFWNVKNGWKKFRPDPINPKDYDAEWKELTQKIDRAWEAFKKYRMDVKVRLRV